VLRDLFAEKLSDTNYKTKIETKFETNTYLCPFLNLNFKLNSNTLIESLS